MDAFDLYKPLRNHLRRVSLLDGLGTIYAYLQYFQFKQPFPAHIEVEQSVLLPSSQQKFVHEWELEILGKEIILNSPEKGECKLSTWNEFAGAVNKLRELEEEITKRYEPIIRPNIFVELYRTAHRQFPWQARPTGAALTRYFKIFGHPLMEPLLTDAVGLTARELYFIGLLFIGHYLRSFGLEHPFKIDVPNLTTVKSNYSCHISLVNSRR